MYPSESKRHFYLFCSDYRKIRIPFYVIGVVCVIASVVLLILFHGRTFIAHGMHNGVPTTHEITILPVSAAIFAFGILWVLIAGLFITGIGKMMMKKPPYPVRTDRRIGRDELLARAAYELREKNPQWDVEVNGNWIDITWNWKDVLGVDSLQALSLNRNTATYSKLIEIGDDYTYQELDMKQIGNFGVNGSGVHLHKSMNVGHFKDYSFQITPGVDLKDQPELGIHKYTLNTAEISNTVHEWLAGYGYSYNC